jgi:hypothetical protein
MKGMTLVTVVGLMVDVGFNVDGLEDVGLGNNTGEENGTSGIDVVGRFVLGVLVVGCLVLGLLVGFLVVGFAVVGLCVVGTSVVSTFVGL